MATQSSLALDTQAGQLIETNSPQLEASLNPTQDFGTRIRSIIFDAPAFKDVEEYKAAFSKAENGAHEAAKKKFNAEADMILHIAMVQSFLSERGVNAELRKAAGIKPGFGEWYETFRAKYDVEYAFKTIQHKIAQLRGGCEHCGRLAENDADHKKSCILYRPLIDLAEQGENGGGKGGKGGNGSGLDMKAAVTAYYIDRYMAMVGLLTNAPADATPQEIIATMQAEAQTAFEDMDAETAKKIKVPKLVKLASQMAYIPTEQEVDQEFMDTLTDEPPYPATSGGPKPQSATYDDWKNHQLPSPNFKLKYFQEASANFTYHKTAAVEGAAFKKVLTILKSKPQQIATNAEDFGNMAMLLEGAADNLNLLATAFWTAVEASKKIPAQEEL